MRVIEEVVGKIKDLLADRKVLEIACGNADFSLEASKHAVLALATDVTLESYMYRNVQNMPKNLALRVTEQPCEGMKDSYFGVAVCFNKVTRHANDLDGILKEMLRVTVKDGYLVFIATQKAEKAALELLREKAAGNSTMEFFKMIQNSKYSILVFKKN